MATETEIRIKGSVDPSVAKAANDAAKTVQDSVEKAQGGKGAAGAGTPSGAGNGLSKAQQAAQFQAQVMLQKLGKLQEGLAGKSSMTAKALSSTIGQIEELSKSGSINASVIAKMTAMYEDFIRNSVELPPDELVDLSKEITAAKTALEKTLKVMDAAVPEVKVEVSADGLKNVEALQQKLEVIGAAKDLDRGLLALEVAAQKTSETVRNRLGKEIGKIREMMSKPLDAAMSKDLEDRAKKIASILAGASGTDTAKAGGAATDVIGSMGRLSGVVNNSEKIREVWGVIAGKFGATGQINDGLAKMLGQSKALGTVAGKLLTFFKGIGGLVLGAATAAVAMIKKVNDSRIEVVKREQQERLASFTGQLDLLELKYQRAIEMSERRARAIRTEIDAEKERTSAIHDLGEAMQELDRAMLMRESMAGSDRFRREQEFAERDRVRGVERRNEQFMFEKKDAEVRVNKATEARVANEERLAGIKRLRAGIGAASASIKDFAADEEMNGVFDFGTLAKKYDRKMRAFFKRSFGTEINLYDYADELKDFKGNFKDLMKTLGEKIVAIQDEIAGQIDEETRAKKNLELYNPGGKKAETLLDQERAGIEEKKKREEDYRYQQEMAQDQRHYALRMRERRQAEADQELKWQKESETASYEGLKKIQGERQSYYEALLRQEEEAYDEISVTVGEGKDKKIKKLRDLNEDEMNERMRWERQAREDRIDELKNEVRNQQEATRKLNKTGFDEGKWNWETMVGKRKERIDEEERQRTRARNIRLGGPMANEVETAKDERHWKKMADEQRAEIYDLLKSYRKKDGSIDYRKLMDNSPDYSRFQQMQGWLDDYRRSEKDAKEARLQAQDDRKERMGQWRLDNMKQGNRLTAMGLGGDVADYNKQMAGNTKELVTLTREMLKTFTGGMPGKRLEAGIVKWSM